VTFGTFTNFRIALTRYISETVISITNLPQITTRYGVMDNC